MSRDGSSGGVIRLAIIDQSGIERRFISGDRLPTFFGKLFLKYQFFSTSLFLCDSSS
jgi:hypothetical protein